MNKASGAHPYTGKVGSDDVDGVDMAYRVVPITLELSPSQSVMVLFQVKCFIDISTTFVVHILLFFLLDYINLRALYVRNCKY